MPEMEEFRQRRYWPLLGENAWPSFGENRWTTLSENAWPSMGEVTWPIIARKMTAWAGIGPHGGPRRSLQPLEPC
jgi:hypothetical protein